MAELTQQEDAAVTAYRDAITTWVDSSSGRDLDKMAKGQLRDAAARLSFATSKGRDELRLPRRTRAKGDVVIIATHPPPDASLLENATTTSSLRLYWDDISCSRCRPWRRARRPSSRSCRCARRATAAR